MGTVGSTSLAMSWDDGRRVKPDRYNCPCPDQITGESHAPWPVPGASKFIQAPVNAETDLMRRSPALRARLAQLRASRRF